MQVFKTYFKISKKHLGAMIIYTGIFIILLNIFVSQKAENSDTDFKSTEIKISIFDHDNSDLSKSLYSFLEERHKIVKIDEDLDTIRDTLYVRDSEYVLIIPEGFESNILSDKQSASDSNNNASYEVNLQTYKIPGTVSGMFVDSQINRFISVYSSYLLSGANADTANEKTTATLTLETEVTVDGAETEDINVAHIYYSYLTYILISVIVLCIAPIIIVFNRDEIKNRTNISCVSPFQKNMYITLASFLFMLVILCMFIILSFMMFYDDMTTDIGMIRILNAFVNAVMCLAFAFFLATFVNNSNLLGFITNFVGLASGFLCGIFIDRKLLGKAIYNFSKILPAHWYINIENELLKYTDISQFTSSTNQTLMYGFVIQILFAIAFFTGGMVISKSRRSS